MIAEIGGGGSGHHVAGVLLVAGRIGDDEFALFGGEEAVGHVDGDALLAFGGEAIDQQGEVDVLALGADLLGVGFERRELILEDHPAVVQQPSDKGRFAVIDGAAGDEAQQALLLVLAEIALDIGREEVVLSVHQK